MKKGLVLLLLGTVFLFSGCSAWKEGSYVSVTPHTGQYTQSEPVSLDQVKTYEELQNSVTDMADKATGSRTLGVDDYTGDLEEDVEEAIRYAREEDPIGAYAFTRLTYRFDRIGSQNVVILDAGFRHTRLEIAAVESVRYGPAANRKLAEALDTFAPSLTLLISGYQDTDYQQIVREYCENHPDTVMEQPKLTVQIYPKTGANRVVELTFAYQTSRDTMWTMQGAVETFFTSAEGYVSMTEDEYVKADRLCAFLMELATLDPGESLHPSYDLLCQGLGSPAAFANVFGAMCRRGGLWCRRVDGTKNGEDWSWNILRIGEAYTFVDLTADRQEGAPLFLGDEDMEGYQWDREAVPACETLWPPVEEPPVEETQDTVPSSQETEESEALNTLPPEETYSMAEETE